MSKNIYGIHDLGAWVGMLEQENVSGWAVTTHALGHNPNDQSGENLNTNNGEISIIARLNCGYGSAGTIPLPQHYKDFAQRCANFVKNSSGISYVIIGNEIQMQWDFPDGQPITLSNYMECYLLCYDAIKSVAPNVRVGPAPVATWNNQLQYPGNERGDWIKLQHDIWNGCGSKIDALYIHAYSHGYDPALITSTQTMDAPFQDRYFHFQVYRQFMEAVPQNLRTLPAFITEMNGDGPWTVHNSGWVQSAYAEINRWNQFPGNQQIRGAALFRWAPHDQKWDLSTKHGSIDDFRQALKKNYQWRDVALASGEEKRVSEKASEPAKIVAGSPVKTVRQVNLRKSPGIAGKNAQDILIAMNPGEIAKIVSESQEKDGLVWWQVEAFSQHGRVTGWICETTPDGEPMIVPIESELATGAIIVTTTRINVRSGPGKNNTTIRTTGVGETHKVVDGPRQADGLNWWNIGVGWVAESVNGVALIKPKEDDVVTRLARQYDIDERVTRAIIAVESGGDGFNPDGTLKIRFENHVFHGRLNSKQKQAFDKIFKFDRSGQQWKGHKALIGGNWIEFHGNQALEYQVLNMARGINDAAAFESISMGAPQIMGFHYQMMGFSSAREMFLAFGKSLDLQIEGMFKFFVAKGLIDAIRRQDFHALAVGYNGTGDPANYANLIKQAIGSTTQG